MSANPLRTLLLVLVVAGFGTVILGTGRFDSFVTRTAADFIASSATVSDGEPSTARSPYGVWSFEFE